MNKSIVDTELQSTPESLDRRNFLAQAGAVVAAATAATAGLAQKVLADEIIPVATETGALPEDTQALPEIEYRESELGIDYRAIADAPVDAMLSQGEAEWMANAPAKFGDKAPKFWKRISSVLGQGTLSGSMEKALKLYAPNMLVAFGENIPGEHPKYGLLAVVGDSFRLDRHLAGEWEQIASL